MSWTTPRNWVTDEVPTAATLNTHIRDNLNYLNTGRQLVITGSNGASPITDDGVTRMLGLGSITGITPVSSRLFASFTWSGWTGDLTNSNAWVGLAYGTGTAPVNGDADTGTGTGQLVFSHGDTNGPGALILGANGLTPGTAYWLDLRINVPNGAGSAPSAPTNINIVVFEV